ncbi:MAG: hypothetical protein IMX01_01000 [Limnochordaceae bacterium]|nr:hypothetical protein [Limnochordaceae bacterium]
MPVRKYVLWFPASLGYKVIRETAKTALINDGGQTQSPAHGWHPLKSIRPEKDGIWVDRAYISAQPWYWEEREKLQKRLAAIGQTLQEKDDIDFRR